MQGHRQRGAVFQAALQFQGCTAKSFPNWDRKQQSLPYASPSWDRDISKVAKSSKHSAFHKP